MSGERMTCDISADLRKWTSGDPEFGPLLADAADKLDNLITLLAEAERVRDDALAARQRAETVIHARGNGHALRVADELDHAKQCLRDTGNALEAAEARLRVELPEALAEVERLTELVAQYAPIAVPILADMAARKERSARMAAHTHYCWTCSNGTAPGSGCHHCRQTGMDQTPCIGCPGPQTDERSGTEAKP